MERTAAASCRPAWRGAKMQRAVASGRPFTFRWIVTPSLAAPAGGLARDEDPGDQERHGGLSFGVLNDAFPVARVDWWRRPAILFMLFPNTSQPCDDSHGHVIGRLVSANIVENHRDDC